MINTNQVEQAADVAKAIHAQVQMNWPAISAAAFIVAREVGNFNRWLRGAAEFVIAHGGIVSIGVKLIWNPPAK